ncbi:MAG TPA: DUF2339 domain-containing protein [Gemmatimonadaceae bacterium]
MSSADDPSPPADSGRRDDALRLAALESQVAALTEEVTRLRTTIAAISVGAEASASARAPLIDRRGAPRLNPNIAAMLREPPRSVGGTGASASPHESVFARATAAAGATISGEEIESLVGRYGTLLLAALVILMGVGVLIQVAVSRGLLTPEVRVGFGALAAVVVGGAGMYFHRKGEVRYGNVLLALSLAIVDLVAWGAGPRLRLIPTPVALAIVDVVAIALAALALRDESEFLFCVAVAGALSSPFVTSQGGGTAPALLTYGAVVLLGAIRAVRQPDWWRAFWVLAGGALVYALASAALTPGQGWYVPFAIVLFADACALGALLWAADEWRGNLARAFLVAGLVGVPVGWDRMVTAPTATVAAVALSLAVVTYAALAVREERQPYWTLSAVALPLLSLAVASARTHDEMSEAVVLGLWAVFALGAWQFERRRGELERGSAHLLAGGLLGAGSLAAALWNYPLPLVAGLAAWGVLLSVAAREEDSPLPLIAVVVSLGGAALSAFDQLASRAAYSYAPFMTRSSASALCATVGLALASAVIGRGNGKAIKWAGRPVRLATVIGFAILWGRMELAQAFNRDVAMFLLTAYYAACGLVSILVGRRLGIQRLRLAGLALAIYAAVKAVVGASDISGVLLRVGAYGAVGVFLLAAGYMYRERRERAEAVAAPTG